MVPGKGPKIGIKTFRHDVLLALIQSIGGVHSELYWTLLIGSPGCGTVHTRLLSTAGLAPDRAYHPESPFGKLVYSIT